MDLGRAGWTNSFVMTPIELIKARLQMQLQRTTIHLPGKHALGGAIQQEFSGPLDCAIQTVRHSGVRGLWHSLGATLLFRSHFAVMFGGYDFFQRYALRFKYHQ